MSSDLPRPPKTDDLQARRFYDGIWRTMQAMGNGLNTVNQRLGINPGNQDSTEPSPDILPELTPPPKPTNVVTTSGLGLVFIQWDKPSLPYSYRVEVWKAATNENGTATQVWSGNGVLAKDTLGSDTAEYFYWVRFIRDNGYTIVNGPWHATSGVKGKSKGDADYILKMLTDGEGNRLPMVEVNGEYFFNSAYFADASIRDAAIKNLDVSKINGDIARFLKANITDGFIENAMIGNEIKSDGFVSGQRGWRIDKSGDAEFNNIRASGRLSGVFIKGAVIEASVFVRGSTELTYPTEADRGDGTVRYLAALPTVESKETVSPGRVNNASIDFMVASANYTGAGIQSYGQGANTRQVYANLDRFPKYRISPTIVALYSKAGDHNGRVATIKVFAIKDSGTEVLLYDSGGLTLRIDGNVKSVPHGRIERIVSQYTYRYCSDHTGLLVCENVVVTQVDYKIVLDGLGVDFNGSDYKGIRVKTHVNFESELSELSVADLPSKYI